MSEEKVENVLQNIIETGGDKLKELKDLPLEALILLINTERLQHLQDKTQELLTELKGRQDQVTLLHKLLKAINAATNAEDGKLNLKENQEVTELLAQTKDLGINAGSSEGELSKEERERLIENIRMTVDDLNVQNDMQLQSVTRLTNERYESYQMARAILKPLHDDKVNKARAIAGR